MAFKYKTRYNRNRIDHLIRHGADLAKRTETLEHVQARIHARYAVGTKERTQANLAVNAVRYAWRQVQKKLEHYRKYGVMWPNFPEGAPSVRPDDIAQAGQP